MGNGDDEAEASDIGREPDESDAVVEAVPMSVSDPEQATVTQVAQMAQEDAGDAGDAEDSDAQAARYGAPYSRGWFDLSVISADET